MADAWAKFDREMSRLERSLEARQRGGHKPRNRGKQNAPNIEANWPDDEPNDNNVIPLGMYLEPPTAELTSRRIGDASALNRAFGREPAADDLPEHWADWAEGDNAGGDFQAQRRALIGSAGPLDPVAPRDPAHSLMIGEPIDELPTLEEARANTVRRRIGRLDEARFGLEPGTLGFVEPAITGFREAVRDRDFGNALEGLGSAILADPSTGRRDPISRRNYDRVYGAPWGANLPGEDGLTDDQRASRRLADQMDPGFLGEDEITITASSRPERFGEAVGGLLAQDSWETPEARQRGLAEPFRDLGDLAVDLWTMPGRSQEEQAAREAGLLFDYSVSGSDMDLRAARQAAGEYGFNAASAGLELTPVGLAGDLASLGRVGGRSVADALPARRLGETAPRAVDLPAPRDTSGAVDAEIAPPEPAPARRFEAALRDPETGEVYTGVDHTDAIESAPDGVRERLDAIYRAPSEDPNAVGFVVNGQFMSREDGLQALRAQRSRPQQSPEVAQVLARVQNAPSDIPRNQIDAGRVRVAYPREEAGNAVSARPATEDGQITTSWGATLNYRRGDMIVGEAQGDPRPVRRDIFEATYSASGPDSWTKRSDVPVGYFVIDQPRTIQTLEGPVQAARGDYILIGAAGEMWPVKPAKFQQRYDLADIQPVERGQQVNRLGEVTPRDPIDWDAPIAPERSALADMGIGRGPNDMQPPSINAAPARNVPQRRLGAQSENLGRGANEIEPEAGTPRERGAIRLTDEQRAALTPDQSYIIERRMQGADYATIADEMGSDPRTLAVQVSKARRRLETAGVSLEVPSAPMGRQRGTGKATDEQLIALRDQLRRSGESNLRGGVNTIIAERFGMTPNAVASRISKYEARRNAGGAAAIGAGAIGAGAIFGDEAFAQMAGEDGILEIGGLEIDTNGELPSMRDAVGAPVVSGDLYVQEFSDGSRHVFRMNRDGERPTPEYVGELVGTSFEIPRVGEGGATYDPGMPSPDWPPLPEGDGLDGELSDGVRIGGTLTAGLVARLMARRAGLGGVAGEIPGVVAAYGFNQVTGGDPVEGALLSGATPFAGRLAEYGAPRLGQAIDDTFYAPGQIARDNERLLSDPQFIMRRNQFAQTLPSAAPRARRLAVERDPLDGYASGRDPSGRMTDASEMLEQGYYADAAPQAMPPRVEFDTLPPSEQLAWMDRAGFAAPRAPAYPDRGNIGFVDGSSPEVEQMRRLGAPERADPFLQPSTGRSVFGEPRRQTVKPPRPPLAERAAERGSTGAMQGVKIAPMREIAEDLGIATEGVKAPELRRTLIRELARRFDSTAELVAFLRSYGVTAAALGIGIGGAQMVTEPEVTM